MGCRSASIAPKSTHQTNPPRNFNSTKNKKSCPPPARGGSAGFSGAAAGAAARCHRDDPAAVRRDFFQPAAVMPSAAALQPPLLPADAAQAHPAAAAWLRNRWISGPDCTEKRKVSAAQSLSFTAASPPTCCAARPAQTARPESIFFAREGFYPQTPRHTMLPECPPYQGRCAAGVKSSTRRQPSVSRLPPRSSISGRR